MDFVSVEFDEALVVFICEHALMLFRLAGHQVAALNVVVTHNNHDLQQPVV